MKKLSVIRESIIGVFHATPVCTVITILAYLILAVIPSLTVITNAELLDHIVSGNRSDAIYSGMILLLFYCLRYLLEFIYSITMNAGIYEKATTWFQLKLYEKMVKIPFLSFENSELLNTKNRAEAAVSSEIMSSIFHRILLLAKYLVTLCTLTIALLQYSRLLLLLVFVSVFSYFLIRLIRGAEFYRLHRFQASKRRKLEYFGGLFRDKHYVKEMRVLGFDDYLARHWQQTRNDVNEELWDLEKKENKSLFICDVIRIVGYGLCIVFSLLLVLQNNISIGVFGACLTAFLELQNTAKDFFIQIGKFPRDYAQGQDYVRFLDLENEEEGDKILAWNQKITAENLSFSYPNTQKNALENVSFVIDKGSTVAIVGENGSGKTTLSRLLLGTYQPTTGQILFDHTPVTEISKEQFQPAVVPQDFVQYHLTVGENITISRQGNTEFLEMFLKENNLNTLLDSMGGIHQQLGKEFGGKDLSQGQWQSLAIARALYCNSELLILDEPTAALDPMTEQKILTSFLNMSKGRTSFIVTHRIGICKKVDTILVLDKGHLVEQGNHSELMKKQGKYYEMFTTQQQWYCLGGDSSD